MASIANDPGGRRRIQFHDPNGKRRTIRLGKVSKRDAESIKVHVEVLNAAAIAGTAPADATARWVVALGEELHAKLSTVGLVAPREAKSTIRLKPFLDEFLAGRSDLKSATKVVRQVVVNDLTDYFGEDRDVTTISVGDADDFKQSLIARKLAPTTIHKRLQVSRWFFDAMRRRKLIAENPFADVKARAVDTRSKLRFVTREETERILEACPNADWRAIVALARYGGLRTPSETLSLKWTDINWESNRVVVTSPKTEHHGKGTRLMPLFPELRAILADVWESAPEGAVYVVNEKYRRAANGPNGWMNANLRTTLTKIIRRAGIVPWPRLLHGLRASRETELVESFPVQAVTDWLGNSPRVAMRHYLLTTDAHFERAVSEPVQAAQNPAQYTAVSSRKASHAKDAAHEKTPGFPGVAVRCEPMRHAKVVCSALTSDRRPGYSIQRAETIDGTALPTFYKLSPLRI